MTTWTNAELTGSIFSDAEIPTNATLTVSAGTAASPSIRAIGDLDTGIFWNAANQVSFSAGGIGIAKAIATDVVTEAYFEVTRLNIGGILLAGDLFLERDSDGLLGIRNGLLPQGLRVYNTFISETDKEFLVFEWISNNVFLLTNSTGTGVPRSITVGTQAGGELALRTVGIDRWQINANGHLLAGTDIFSPGDNTYDIGADGATRPRTGYFGTGLSVRGTVSGTGVVAVGNGTPPTAQANTVALYSTDNAAGNTIPSFFCEGTDVLSTGQADSVSSVRVKMRINGTVVTLLAI